MIGRMRLERTLVIDRSPAEVFRFYAVEHVRNHPRWDPDMHLEPLTPGPIGMGTVIRRRHSRSGEPTEGTMEIVEYEPERSMRGVIHDGPVQMRGWMMMEGQSAGTNLTVGFEILGARIRSIPPPSSARSQHQDDDRGGNLQRRLAARRPGAAGTPSRHT
jgi:hypothetical protein